MHCLVSETFLRLFLGHRYFFLSIFGRSLNYIIFLTHFLQWTLQAKTTSSLVTLDSIWNGCFCIVDVWFLVSLLQRNESVKWSESASFSTNCLQALHCIKETKTFNTKLIVSLCNIYLNTDPNTDCMSMCFSYNITTDS